jgi:predicted alpha/beta superfamily hydrolase
VRYAPLVLLVFSAACAARDTEVDLTAQAEDGLDGVIKLRVHYPARGHTVSLRGSAGPLDWSRGVPMTRVGEDTFELTFPKSLQVVECKVLLDDAIWSRGPNLVLRRGKAVDVYPYFHDAHGKVSRHIARFHSNVLADEREIWVYLPPSYAENTLARHPVVYMHDGEKLFDPQPKLGARGWRVDATLDAGAENGTIREAIVVGVGTSDDRRDYEYTPTSVPAEHPSGGGDAYLRMIVTELKPRIDRDLRTMPGRETTALVGSSYGGLLSAYAGVKEARTFGLVGALSPSTWWDDEMLVATVRGAGRLRPLRVYLDNGGLEDGKAETDRLAAAYRAQGYADGRTLAYVVREGAHDEASWATRLPAALGFLLGPRSP